MEEKIYITDVEKEEGVLFKEIVEEFYESCVRNGYYDMRENARVFCKENNHICDLSIDVVTNMLEELNR